MGITSGRQTVCDQPADGVRVVRFVRPDVREQLYDNELITDCALFGELQSEVVSQLASGETMVLNLGLIDRFPTAFFRFLLELNREVQGRKARLLLCCLTPNVREAFDLMGGTKSFPGQLRETEERAIYDARHPAG